MKATRIRVLVGAALGLTTVLLNSSVGRAVGETTALVCGSGRTITEAIKTLSVGDRLLVSGTCNENVDVDEAAAGITLDGQGTATINGDPSANTVTIAGRGITIRGFTITGGAHGVAIQDAASATIDGNAIQYTGKNGIVVFRNSTARIINNAIRFNPSGGINVGHTSSALIGFTGPPGARVRAPNGIQNNGGPGIQILRESHAQIFSNRVQNNATYGVLVDRNSHVEISANAIAGNGSDGIRGMRNAGVDLGTDATGATPQFDDDTNTGVNTGFGVRCTIGGFVDGALGTLTGTSGPSFFGEACTNSVQ